MTLLPMLLLLALATPGEIDPGPCAVAVLPDGSARPLSAAELRDPAEVTGARVLWVWSDTAPPERFGSDRLPPGPVSEARERLRIRVAIKKGKGSTVSPKTVPTELIVRAAPRAMWSEVPEALLPSWQLPESGELAIPHDPAQAWRVRLTGPDHGTWWRDVGAGRSQVYLVPSPAESYAISIVSEGGAALPEAILEILEPPPSRRLGQRPLALYAADAKGEVRVQALPDSIDLMWVVLEAAHAPTGSQGRSSSLPSRIVLAPGATVVGSFADRLGTPVSKVRVGISAFVAPGVPFSILRPATSAADGSWQVAGLPSGEMGLMARADGFAPRVEKIEVNAEVVNLGELTLQRAGLVRFLVVDESDEPIAGALVRLDPLLRATSDSQGYAEIDQAPAGATLSGHVEMAGYVPLKFQVQPPLTDAFTVRLTKAFGVSGRFLDPESSPVVGGTLRVETGNRSKEEPVTPDGRFEVELPPNTRARLVLASPSTSELRVAVDGGAAGESQDLGDLVAPSSLVVTGRVLAAAEGAPVSGGRIWSLRFAGDRSLVSWIKSDVVAARTDEEGRFRLTGLAPQPAQLRVEAPGFARRLVELKPEPGHLALDIGDVELSEGATVRITSDEDLGAGAVARVDLGNEWLEPDMLTAPVSEGLSVVRHVPAGRATVSVVRGERLVCDRGITVPEGPELIEVECSERGMTVRGTVEVGGYPAGPGLLSWRPPGHRAGGVILNYGTPSGLTQNHVLWGGRPDAKVPVDAGGHFSSDSLRPGTWEVAWSSGSDSLAARKLVELPEVEQHELVLSFPGMTVHGMVSAEDGSPVSRARVRELAGGAFAFSAEDGTFSLNAAEAGILELQARLEERSSEVVRVELEADRAPEPVHLVLEDRRDDKITIRVLGPDERPFVGALVFLEEESKSVRILTTDTQGKAETSVHPPHSPRVRAAAMAGGIWALDEWRSLEAAPEGLTLKMGEHGSLSLSAKRQAELVRVVSPHGWNVSWLLTRLGLAPEVSPERPLLLDGLPVGTYDVLAGTSRHRVSIEGGDTSEVTIE